MYYNREKELRKEHKYHEAWNISKKYTDILMLHSENDRNIDMCFAIHSQYMNELRTRNIPRNKKINYVQCWDTLLNTLLKNPKINVQRGALKLLHQTNVQRSYAK
tara:strand:- start:321 stop:635 length:315 start_codon:yes stop_codon:yes gene_type:complete